MYIKNENSVQFWQKTLHWSAYRIVYCSHLQVTWVQLCTVMYTDGAKQRKCAMKTRWNGVKKIRAVLVCYERMRTNLKYVHKEDQMGNWLDEVCLKCCKGSSCVGFYTALTAAMMKQNYTVVQKNITSFFLNNSLKNELIFSERELTFTFAIRYRLSVRLSVCRLPVCNVRASY